MVVAETRDPIGLSGRSADRDGPGRQSQSSDVSPLKASPLEQKIMLERKAIAEPHTTAEPGGTAEPLVTEEAYATEQACAEQASAEWHAPHADLLQHSSATAALMEPQATHRGGLTLICGPAGGGKSRWAEALASRSGRQVIYLATGPLLPDDADWQRRLDKHRRRRPQSWRVQEVGGELAVAIEGLQQDQLGLIDSLGTWVAAWLDSEERAWEQQCSQLQRSITSCPVPLLVVSEQVGWGVVPHTAVGERFRRRLAGLERQLMLAAASAWLVVAGRALDLHRLGEPVPPEW